MATISEQLIKEQFFAQYWGQKALKLQEPELYNVGILITNDINEAYLLLRGIVDLTDDHAHIIGDILGLWVLTPENVLLHLERIKIREVGAFSKLFNYHKALDVLRLLGYLIEFTYLSDGKPITLSVEELLQRGFVKLKNH